MRTFVTICASIAVFIFAPAGATAQFNVESFTSTELSIELQPEFPKPGDQITASLNDYSGGVYGSSIDWYLDGQGVPDASNQRQIIFTAGENNRPQTVKLVLTKPEGGQKVLETTIYPTYLDVIIEPQTHVPDFYRGRSLPSVGSIINATALISGEGFRNPDLVYTWRVGQTILEGGPVRGKNTVSFPAPMDKQFVLSLQVSTLTGEVIARRATLIPSVSPEIHFYEVSSLFGLSQQALDSSLALIGNSVVVRAEPYHLDSKVYNNPTIHEWEIDQIPATYSGGNPYEVTLQRTGSAGVSNLGFHVRDTTQILQGAKSDININF